MRLTILRMLSTNSLAAFSASAGAAGLGPAAPAPAGPISRVRATGIQSPPQPAAPALKMLPPDGASPPPGRAMPRGSLLDLSV